jgi:Tol biopolymer transport system component
MALAPGTRIGPYEITAPIDSGGMGEVYRATDTNLKRQVAIKVLPAALAGDPDRLTRFQREAEVLASLNHPHIAHIHGLERSGGTTALVMELVEGPTLADRIARGAIPVDETLAIARQIAEALEAAHEQGIIHRDLKPANIKVRDDGTVKVLDFGLAKALEPKVSSADVADAPTITSPAMTQAGVILGTAAYMSPEQAKGRAVDKRADIWAFGCVLYEMLRGARLFASDSVPETLGLIFSREPDLTKLPEATPPRVRALIARCLVKDPRQRLRDIGEARLTLDVAHDTTGTVLPAPAPVFWRAAPWGVASVFGLIALLLVPPAIRAYRTARPDSPRVVLDLATPATDDPISFALSPDGQQLVFVAHGEANIDKLWVRPLGDDTPRPLPDTEGASYPFWAPNSREVGFFADRKLKRIDVTGGSTAEIADAPSGRGGAWNQDDVIVFVPSTGTGLFRVNARGGPVAQVTDIVAGQRIGPRWPQFLPDGRHFIFYLGVAPEATRGIYLTSLDGGEPRRVLASESAAAYLAPGYLVLVRQEVLVAVPFDGSVTGEATRLAEGVGTDNALQRSAFSVATNGRLAYRAGGASTQRRQLVWVDRAGTLMGAVSPPDSVGAQACPELSPDERRIVLHSSPQRNVDVWLVDVTRGGGTRFTSDPGADTNPVWSPDGRRIVFDSSRQGVYDLFEKPADDTAAAEKPLLVNPDEKLPLSWSQKGYLLYRTTGSNTGRDLWALPMVGEQKPFPVVRTNGDEDEGQISPDGNWIAYGSTQSGGRLEIYLDSFPKGRDLKRISTGGGSQVRWAPHGRELYYITPDGHLMAVPLARGQDAQSLKIGPTQTLFQTRLATGANVSGAKPQYAVARDGRFLMNVRVDETRPAPLTIVLNGMAALVR